MCLLTFFSECLILINRNQRNLTNIKLMTVFFNRRTRVIRR